MSEPSDYRHLVVGPSDEGKRLDIFLSESTGLSRNQAQALISGGQVLLNELRSKTSTRVRSGDVVAAPTVSPGAGTRLVEPQEIPFSVVYEDEDVLVVDKPAGLVVHPAPGHEDGTLVNALLARYPDLAAQGGERPGIVHRLDKDTSGLMLVARSLAALQYLQEEMQAGRVLKEYTLLCCGHLRPPKGVIEGPIGRHPTDRLRMSIVSSGRPATTAYRTLAEFARHSLVEARLHTGRTHQIRVHFFSVGHPIAGDPLYGKCRLPGLDRQFLHSSRLSLVLPSGVEGEWSSPLPPDLAEALRTVAGY